MGSEGPPRRLLCGCRTGRLDFCKWKRLPGLGVGLEASAGAGAGSVRALGRCALGSCPEGAAGLDLAVSWSGEGGSDWSCVRGMAGLDRGTPVSGPDFLLCHWKRFL